MTFSSMRRSGAFELSGALELADQA